MFALANLLVAIAKILDVLLTIYMYIVIARAIISWVNPDPYNPIVNFLYRATEPVLSRIRRVLPDMGGFDLSPILVFLIIMLAQNFLVRTLYDYGYSLKIGGGLP